MEKTVYECESCRELGSKIYVFEGTMVKRVLNAPQMPPATIKAEVCCMDCLIKKVRKQFGPSFEEKPIRRRVLQNNGKSNGKVISP